MSVHGTRTCASAPSAMHPRGRLLVCGASQFFLTRIYRAHYMAEVSKLWILRRAVSN